MNVPISIPSVADSITDAWSVRDLVTADDAVLRLIRLEGDFEWHHHDEDELFLCWRGTFRIEQDNGRPATVLSAGDLFVVPRGANHRLVADDPAYAVISVGAHTMAPA